MKKEDLKRVVFINSELESIERKLIELNNLEVRLNKPEDLLSLKIEGVPGIYEVKNMFTQSDLTLITSFRKIKLVEKRSELEKELENL